jgi:RNA polymerase sigma-70 factor (ECF subfamily)
MVREHPLSTRETPSHPPASSVEREVTPSAPRAEAPEPALLERVRARDPEALGQFYDRYLDLVFGLAWRLIGDRTLAEDAASEVFLKVHRAADRLDPARDPAPWLTTITTNVCRDLWRSGAYRMSRRAADVDDPAAAATLSSGRNDPEADALSSERERLVQAALLELPEPLRTTIVLHDYQGLDHRQVAEVLHIAHDAARKRYSRALAALELRLKGRLG